jgi:hypothetical protein
VVGRGSVVALAKDGTRSPRDRRTAMATVDDFWEFNRTGHLLEGGPPETGWPDDGVHGGDRHHTGGRGVKVAPV